MSLIADLEYERNRYYQLRDDINKICTNLNNSIEQIDNASIQLDKYYLIDDERVDNYIFRNTLTNLDSIYNILVETIIPAINTKINQLSNEINQIQEVTIS